ncbi:VHS-domain-containing protein [Phellopilus nigrolimitatus]|nr:VHS-domain-containing protein [Phellopilus nigrolimitatus]
MFGGDFMRNISPLQSLIARAVDPYKHEPDYAAHLEVAEFINSKKANTPRDAAMTIARIVNNRNPHIAVLALALLETLVQQCGYAFHLQIATKEFLNELVRRFPERPPPFPGPVMSKILELIHTWKDTICSESRWKEDLGNIRDMHRLLTFKGYRFRELPRAQPAVASTSNLKSAEELEEEDREAQAAKLQELIRRGTPRDLAAAQELMKALAGAEPDKKPDYRSQSLTELNKLEQKVILLNEMLDNVDTERGERFASGDVYDQVSGILSAARPKIQKWISDAESGDPEMLDIFLQMNDQINSVLNRYEAFRKGDYSAAANPIPAELASSSRTQDTSLIDFDDLPHPCVGTSAPPDDLTSIFGFSASPAQTAISPQSSQQQRPQRQGISIPIQQPTPTPSSPSNGGSNPLAGLFDVSPPPSQGGGGSSGPVLGSIMLPGTPQPQRQAQAQGSPYGSPSPPQTAQQPQGTFWSMQAGLGAGAAPSRNMLGAQTSPSLVPQQSRGQQQQQQTASSAPPPAQGKDPFADLAGLF